MTVKIKGNSKSEIAKKIVKKFHGTVTIETARKMVKNIVGEKKVNVDVPKWFRFRDSKGHFVKMGK